MKRAEGLKKPYYWKDKGHQLGVMAQAAAYGTTTVGLAVYTTPYVAGFVGVCCVRRLTVNRAERVAELAELAQMEARAMPARKPTTKKVAEKVVETPFVATIISVWQSDDGPCVSLISAAGEILTKTFPSWPSASRYIAKTEAYLKSEGIAFKYVSEKV